MKNEGALPREGLADNPRAIYRLFIAGREFFLFGLVHLLFSQANARAKHRNATVT